MESNVVELLRENEMPINAAMRGLFMEFLAAIARTHPEPAALLAAFKDEMRIQREGELSTSELTPPNRLARGYRHSMEKMLIALLAGRIPPDNAG